MIKFKKSFDLTSQTKPTFGLIHLFSLLQFDAQGVGVRIQPEFSSLSIVAVGNFNPVIFSPLWLNMHDLISEEELNKSTIKIIHPEISQFSVGWADFLVEKEKITLTTREAPWIRLHDLMVGIFEFHLPHTPLFKLGINRHVYFSAGTVEIRDKVGKALAPHEPWGPWGKILSEPNGKNRSGMASLVMRQHHGLDDRVDGFIDVRVEPCPPDASRNSSLQIAGISVGINDHYEATKQAENGATAEVVGAGSIMKVLKNNFERSVNRSDNLIDLVMAMAT